jgi:ubiquinone/menaquinone biosynthesis C-methylase UbiE
VSDYASITEAPGLKATQEQLARLYHRYRFALDYVKGKDVLEAACGTGIGLGLLARYANCVVGGDIDKKNIAIASNLYRNDSLQIREMDVHNLPFGEKSFDVILLFEAIYYLEHPEIFVKEAYRILRRQGVLIICTVNRDWEDFHPSPYTHRYFSVPELAALLNTVFQNVQFYGAFSTQISGIVWKIVSFIKKVAVQYNLIPGSLAARAYLKRLFMGPLQPLPQYITDGMLPYEPPVPISSENANRDYKIIYAVAGNN